MPERPGNKKRVPSSKQEERSEGQGYQKSEFILLDDLVYAPLYALAKSNERLRAHIVEAIKNLGTVKQNGQEEIVQLNNINIVYDQIHPGASDEYSVDNLQLRVPLMSIVPISNLNVEQAQIGFSTEIKVVNGQNGQYKINGRICSPEQRDSDFLPRVSYDMTLKSIPATEGIMRLTDILSANQVAKKLDTTPLGSDGNLGSDEQKGLNATVSDLRARVEKLKQLYKKVADMIAEQERLSQISKDAFEEDTYEFDKDKYLMVQSNITNRIMEYQEKIMNLEIEFGMDKEDESL